MTSTNRLLALALLLLGFSSCGSGNSCTAQTAFPAGVSSAPSLTYYYGLDSASSGTALAAALDISGYISNAGCGPFGVWGSGNGGEVATEIEMRINTRLGVYAMVSGVVTVIQASSAPGESGEVEGVWISYGTNYVIKYVHVKDPIVAVGDHVSAGQKIGSTVASGGGYFIEAELRQKVGDTIYAIPFNSLLSNAAPFNALYGAGNCTPGGVVTNDGSTVTTASNWVNDSLSPARVDVTSVAEPCSFAE